MKEFPKTDIDNAERFVEEHGDHIKYCQEWGKWIVWDGNKWVIDDEAEVQRRAEETVRGLVREAKCIGDSRERDESISHALKSQSDHSIRAMLNRVKHRIAIKPEEFDSNQWLFNTIIGTVDLRTGERLDHNSDHLITKMSTVLYIDYFGEDIDPKTGKPLLNYSCPQWLEFLDRILGGNTDLIRYLQKAIGYSLTGDTREQIFFLLYGEGNNGKSTFLEMVRLLFGDYACQTGFSTFLVQKNDTTWHELARLKGARLVTAVESDAGKTLNESVIKQITGGDMITARFLYQEYFEYKPQFKLFLATNHKPEIRGRDYAIWRRVKLIPFTVEIPKEEQDLNILSKFLSEIDDILSWAVEGCLLWQKEGLEPPKEIEAATEEYKTEMDTFGHFLDERCNLGSGLKARAQVLYNAYRNHCDNSGRRDRILNKKEFVKELEKREYHRCRDNKGNYWEGLDLKHSSLEMV